MKTNEQKGKFVELRAKGLSFDKISEELDVSKPTLLKWNKELYKEIANAEFLEAQTLTEQFKLSSKKKIEVYSKKLQEVYEALEKQDLSNLAIKDLLQLKSQLEADLVKEKSKIKYYSGEIIEVSNDILDLNVFGTTKEEVTYKLE